MMGNLLYPLAQAIPGTISIVSLWGNRGCGSLAHTINPTRLSNLVTAILSSNTTNASAMCENEHKTPAVCLSSQCSTGDLLTRLLFFDDSFSFFLWGFAYDWRLARREVVPFEGDLGSLGLVTVFVTNQFEWYGVLGSLLAWVVAAMVSVYFPVTRLVSVTRACDAVAMDFQMSCHAGVVRSGSPKRFVQLLTIGVDCMVFSYVVERVRRRPHRKNTRANVSLLLSAAGKSTLANEECKAKKRQTISAQDVIKALHDVDMDSFVTPLETFLHATKSTKKPVVKASPSIDALPEHEDNVAPDTSIEEDDEETKDEHIPDDDMNEQDD
ncbi:hypothetical protein DYB30_006478 [Aphanomyces astaci]|uniref:Transcription factor CBF/NF-Y/archaeal histone domain-containing protein n=1 Tax=Aphanomyces astaci TaxID=112090 RepID=A0A397DAB4_APHAT|nr:hypothetical protein DYB30_006478 [Aphanomyces astaci]RHY90152.1 hypothetical protein DYB31_008779 [Aphanomyces astaci]